MSQHSQKSVSHWDPGIRYWQLCLSGPMSAALRHHSEIDHLRHIWCFILMTTNPLLLWPLFFYPSHRNRQEAKARQSAALLWTWSSVMSSGFVSRCLEKDCGTVAMAVLLSMSHCRHLPVRSILHWRDLSVCCLRTTRVQGFGTCSWKSQIRFCKTEEGSKISFHSAFFRISTW